MSRSLLTEQFGRTTGAVGSYLNCHFLLFIIRFILAKEAPCFMFAAFCAVELWPGAAESCLC